MISFALFVQISIFLASAVEMTAASSPYSDVVCSKYSSYVQLSAYESAASYCAQNYPVGSCTVAPSIYTVNTTSVETIIQSNDLTVTVSTLTDTTTVDTSTLTTTVDTSTITTTVATTTATITGKSCGEPPIASPSNHISYLVRDVKAYVLRSGSD